MPSIVKEALLDGLNDYLKHFEYEHCITAVKKYTPDPSMIVLQPTSFCLTCTPGGTDGKECGTVGMWISVTGSSGQKSGRTSIEFRPDTKTANPIPVGCSASIIFSHDLMARKFFMVGFLPGIYLYPGVDLSCFVASRAWRAPLRN